MTAIAGLEGRDFGRGGPDRQGISIDPSIEEFRPVRPLFANGSGALCKRWIVTQERAAFAGVNTPGLVGAVRSQGTKCAQRLVAMVRKRRLRRVFYQGQSMPLSTGRNRLHLAGDVAPVVST
jgi:hypothetical protein